MALASVECGGGAYELGYELVGAAQSPAVLILHGWGANKELMKRAFGGELQNFCHIYLDLCGFGKSSIDRALSSFEYAKIVGEFLRQKKLAPQIIIAHSFGGKIAALLSAQIPLKVLVLLSSAGIVWRKSLKVRGKIALFKCLKRLGISRFGSVFASKDVAGMSQTMYETFKKVVDEDFCEIFASVKCPALIFWGTNDDATPLKSGEKIHSLIANSEFYALNGGHFFFLENAKFIAQKIQNTLENTAKNKNEGVNLNSITSKENSNFLNSTHKSENSFQSEENSNPQELNLVKFKENSAQNKDNA